MSDTLEGMMTEEEFLQHMADLGDEGLEHYGVKGMKWGHNSKGQSLRTLDKAARAENKAAKAEARRNPVKVVVKKAPNPTHFTNKEAYKKAKAKYNAERDAEIDSARERVNSGQSRQQYKDAKATYRVQRNEIGKVAARRALTAAKSKYISDYEKSQEYKSGRETTIATITAVAGIVANATR